MADIKALIAKQRAELEVENRSELDVVLGGEIVTLSIERVHPDVWDTLMGDNPPRAGVEGDSVMGYNPKGVSASYPNVMVDGEVMDPETWAEMYSVLDSVHRNKVELVIWGINVNAVLQELQELGKGRAGKK
jgi:hypothetical protein